MTPVWMFPGQSSFRADLVRDAIALSPRRLAPVVEQAEATLGRSLRAFSRSNRDVQVGLFLANHLHALALEAAGVRATRSLGLSLGEYNHLVHIGAIDFFDALRIIDARGAAYELGPEGCMAAVFPLPLDELNPLLAGTSAAVANFNSPTQHVIAGTRADVALVCQRVEEETFAEHRLIEPNIAMHHPLFAPVAQRFGAVLASASWMTPKGPYISNVLGGEEPSPTPSRIVELLTRHVAAPVLWRACLEHVVAAVPDAAPVEVGPGTVLSGLLRRGWIGRSGLHTDGPAALNATITALSSEGLHGHA